MQIGRIKSLAAKYRSLLALIAILLSYTGYAQYNPSIAGTTSNKPYAPNVAAPTDSRSYYYDQVNFVWRPYTSTSEVLFYLNLPKYRAGGFDIIINTGGILSGGIITGGVNTTWYFKNGTADSNLVVKISSAVDPSLFLLKSNNLSDLQSISTAKTNLSLNLVDNTSDATKNAASVTLTNHTISGANNIITGLPNSALNNSSIGFTIGTSGSDFNITGTPVPLGGSIAFNFPSSSASNRGLLTASDWAIFNAKQGTITLTTTGTSGAATFIGNILNIPQYSGAGGTAVDSIWRTPGKDSIQFTISGRYHAILDSTATAGSGITSLNGLTGATQTFATGTTGTDFGISSSGTIHTFNIPSSSALNRGLLTSADWSTFNNKLGTASNGLTATAGNVVLGGNLTQTTSVRGVFGIPKLLTFDTLSLFQARALTLADTTKLVMQLDSSLKKSELSAGNARASGYFRANMVTTNDAGISANVGKVGSTLYGSPLFQALSSDSSMSFRASRLYFDNDTTLTSSNAGIFIKGLPYTATTSGRVAVIWDQTTQKLYTTAIGTGGGGGGISTLNTLTASTQTFATGTSGSDFNIVSATSTHTFNFPSSSASNRGLLTAADWSTFNGKLSDPLTTNGDIIARISGSTTRLPQGANGTFLGVSGGALGYYTPSGASQTLQQVLTTGSTLTQANTVNYAGFTQSFTGGLTKIDSIQFNVFTAPMTKTGTLNGLGDSFRNPGTGSTAPNDSTELPLLADTLQVAYNNLALSGSGVRYAISQMDSLINGPFNTSITWVQAGYNDARAAGNNSKTPLKVVSALVSGFINHFADEYITGSDTTTAFIHRYGTYTTGLNSTSMGGKTKNGAQTSTLNDSITYDFVGRYAGVVLKGGDGSAIITSIVRVNIDGGSTTDYNTTVADGTTVVSVVNTSIPYGIVLDAGTYGKHHVKIVNTEAKIMYIDYFAPLSPGVRGPYIVNHLIYPVASAGTQYLAVNNAIDSTWATLPTSVFPTWYVLVNDVFDRTTGLSGDGTHPNNTGYRQIFRSEMIQWNARANSQRGVVVADSTGLYVFSKGYRRLVEPAEVFTRSEAAYNFTSYVGVPANASYKVGGIDVWKADVTNKNYLIGNGAGVLLITSTGTGNFFGGDLAGTNCTTCANNMGLGTAAMQLSTTSSANTAVGPFALQQNTTGGSNTGVGFGALKATATGSNSTGVGQGSFILNTASNNTGVGSNTGASNTTGTGLTYIGYQAGNANTTSNFNTGDGYQSLFSSTGSSNTANGAFAQAFQSSGTGNASVGLRSLYGSNGVAGAFNYSSALGYDAGRLNGVGGDFNIYIGDSSGWNNTSTSITGKFNIVIGNGDTLLSPTVSYFMNLGHVIYADRGTRKVTMGTDTLGASFLNLVASTTGGASLNMPAGTAPTSPNHGDMWTDANHIYSRLNGVTYQLDQQSTGGTPGGANTQVQFNNSGAFGGSANLTWASNILTTTNLAVTTLTNAGANDSVVTWDPASKQFKMRNGIFTLKVANGLTASSGQDSLFWGGTLIQNTTISGGNFSVALGTSGSKLSNLSIWSTAGVNLTGGQYASSGGSQLLEVASTINNPITAGSGNVTNFSAYFFQAPTVTSTNASVTYANPATFRIENSPTMSTNSTATGLSYALDVAAGISHFGVGGSSGSALFDGIIALNGASLSNGTGMNLGAPTTTRSSLLLNSGSDPTASGVLTGSGNMWNNAGSLYFVDGSGTGVKRDISTGINNFRHTIFTPTTGGTVTAVALQENIINPAGTLATLTIALPASPNDNDVINFTTTQTLTAITYSGGTVVGPTTRTAGQWHLVFDAGTTSWY